MSESGEASLAAVPEEGRQGRPFVAIRSRVEDGEARSVVSRMMTREGLTFRDVGALLPRLQRQTGTAVTVPALPPGTRPGFLAAVADLIETSLAVTSRATGTEPRFDLVYRASGPLAGVPVSIPYRPRWWLEIDLELA